ncbi:MAG: 30S ribosomal protein S20 [Verrucomicrobiae bacterium]|nr:30S ribosomal protein S20 [Verrucomicrobiae bacterium]
MPNTLSAERRMRKSARRYIHNKAVRSQLKTLQKKFLVLLNEGKKEEATAALRVVHSALDKAVKYGVLHKATANRKKSRLALKLAALKSAPAA